MNLFSTQTPPYEKQPSGTRQPDATGLTGWFAGLLRTRTPAYTYPVLTAQKPRGQAETSKP